MSQALPTVVIVGRPNVGKSTLFNRITGQRKAIVGNQPGITRDRIHGLAEHRGRSFEVIDTGGIVPGDAAHLPEQVLRQAQVAIERAAQVILLVDGRAEITATDRELARLLRRTGKPVTLAVNKIDSAARDLLAHEFHALGIEHLFPISCEHGLGVDALLDHITADFTSSGAAPAPPAIRVSILGRPNVGKSTLLNTLTGEERVIVSAEPGTTRDAVDERVSREGTDYVFVDTAGIRRKGKTTQMAEKLSVVMARRHIRMADVVLVVLDGLAGVVGLDATIAGYAHEGGRAGILCVNKCDAIEQPRRAALAEQIKQQLKFLDYAPVVFLSARTGAGVGQLFPLIKETYEAACRRITTGELNRFVADLHFEERRIKYITQASVRPPTFVLFTDGVRPLHFSHQRYLVNQIRKRFGFRGTPIVVKTRT